MAKSSPPVPSPRPAADRVPARAERTGPTLPPVQVRYYRRMHPQRVYSVTVSWHNRDERRPPAGARPVLLRLLMAGAQVVPSEQPLDPAKRDAQATFYVTPLARGWLRGERLEILMDGRKVQEMPLSSHVTTQKMTWFLLALTILVPWFLLTYCTGPLVQVDAKAKIDGKRVLRTRGELLEKDIAAKLPDVPDFLKETEVREYLLNARRFVVDIYDSLLAQSSQRPLAFYAGACLLLLTAISWWAHRAKRKRRLGMPIPIPMGAAVPLAADA